MGSPAILNTYYPARKAGSKAPTVPRPGSPSILIPSAPRCASSASIGEASGPRAAIEPDRSEHSVGNACEPNRSSDRNGPATRKTISLGQLELEGILRIGLNLGHWPVNHDCKAQQNAARSQFLRASGVKRQRARFRLCTCSEEISNCSKRACCSCTCSRRSRRRTWKPCSRSRPGSSSTRRDRRWCR